jgi:hypothetical protein
MEAGREKASLRERRSERKIHDAPLPFQIIGSKE